MQLISNLPFTVAVWIVLAFSSAARFAVLPEAHPGHAETLQAQCRGCETQGWCRFWNESMDPLAQSTKLVYPNAIARQPGDKTVSIAVRDRLNALLANMIHQHKPIVLHSFRDNGDGTFTATVRVNEMNVASDPMLLQLLGKTADTPQ